MTVKELIEELKKMPEDAVVNDGVTFIKSVVLEVRWRYSFACTHECIPQFSHNYFLCLE